MVKVKSNKFIIAYAAFIGLAFVSLMLPFTLSLFTKEAESNGFYGEVSLRSYFERGTGRPAGTDGPDDPGDPYVITRPRHLYNLSRLQGLGVFNEKKAFQLGMVGLGGDTSGEPMCYLDDSSSTVVPFIDMKDSNLEYEPITAIGTEAVPFFGEFDGQGLEIKNLTVYADPEDAGLFGYTAHGSIVKNLFLSNVTINSLGYSANYAGLYGPSSTASNGVSLIYTVGGNSETFLLTDTSKTESLDFDASPIFDWNEQGGDPEPTITEDAPVISFTSSSSNYRYKFLISGDFLKDNGDGTASIDLPAIYKFFKREKANTTSFPLTATSSVSLVASTTDNYGLDHSKVIVSMDFNFSLNSATSNALFMTAHLGEEHMNNIGLVIGHCDGSVDSCYVHNGAFVMNNAGESYTKMRNGSNFGLIGLIGGTVHNFAAQESEAGTSAGKDIGVLDFTTVYNDIITPTSFSNSVSLGTGVTYVPSDSRMYAEFLRKNNNNQYVTLETNSVSFNRQKVISNSDLGIFTIATDQTGTGMGLDATNGLSSSVVRWEDVSVNDSYYVYYATGEYDKSKGVSFSDYRSSLSSDTPSVFHPGYHFPHYDEISSESFEQRDMHQNYVVRFKIDANYRTGKGFYFSDVDKTSVGGSFMSKYFENKLVDKDGNPIRAAAESKLSGVMLRTSLGQEVRSLASSFATPDLSLSGSRMFCIDNEDYGKPAANMINFEIKTNTANVTVVAGLVDNSRPAALGVYKIGDQRSTYNNQPYVNIAYNNPDYAFFMPTTDNLAYFDYTVNNEGIGKIGTYDSLGNFTEANVHTDATVPAQYNSTEYGYSTGKTRLYAHTFKLEPGRYCFGSATGVNTANATDGIAKIFYVCAQGQTDGNIEFIDNTFASEDEVKNIDFIKKERFTYNEGTGAVTTNITTGDVVNYNPDDPKIENQRCYISLMLSERSLFEAAVANVEFVYEDNKFKINSDTLGAILNMTVSSYATNHGINGLTNTPVSLFGGADTTESKIVYPPAP